MPKKFNPLDLASSSENDEREEKQKITEKLVNVRHPLIISIKAGTAYWCIAVTLDKLRGGIKRDKTAAPRIERNLAESRVPLTKYRSKRKSCSSIRDDEALNYTSLSNQKEKCYAEEKI